MPEMNLAKYIQQELDHIVEEWEGFARSNIPPARDLSVEELRDHARVLLQAVIADMQVEQAGQAQNAKSRGDLPNNSPQVTETSQAHAEHRFAQGFTLNQMVSEYRALRASVLRRYIEATGEVDRAILDCVIRFGETMDQGLTEAIAWYVGKVTESRGLLLGVLGHDMRTPLGAARMSAQFLLQTEPLDKDQMKAVVRIVNSTGRLRAMVDDLLDFTKTALGVKLPISPAPFDVGEVCAEVIAEVGALHPGRPIKFERTGDLNGNWDSARIAQLVANLVSNAVQHGDSGFPVTVTAQAEGDAVSICVHNSGSLVSPEARGTLFEPLKQGLQAGTDRHTGSSGLGLGLYIAKEIAVAHGGSIEVASTEQDGTSFIARLPRNPPAST
jgi:signal transduction histidine kinase